jgi:hypothetical protein
MQKPVEDGIGVVIGITSVRVHSRGRVAHACLNYLQEVMLGTFPRKRAAYACATTTK